MTDEERIKSILKELEYDYISYNNLLGDDDHGCRLIEEALKKQVPMKPVLKLHTNRVPDQQKEWYCPNCDEWITWDWRWKCCAYCGQKIDWNMKG